MGGRELDINQPRPAAGASVALIMDETGLILLRKRKPVIVFLRGAAYLPDLLCLKRGQGVFVFFFIQKNCILACKVSWCIKGTVHHKLKFPSHSQFTPHVDGSSADIFSSTSTLWSFAEGKEFNPMEACCRAARWCSG